MSFFRATAVFIAVLAFVVTSSGFGGYNGEKPVCDKLASKGPCNNMCNTTCEDYTYVKCASGCSTGYGCPSQYVLYEAGSDCCVTTDKCPGRQ